MKKTPVLELSSKISDIITHHVPVEKWNDVLKVEEEAMEIEKHELSSAFSAGFVAGMLFKSNLPIEYTSGEDYYNKVYMKNNDNKGTN